LIIYWRSRGISRKRNQNIEYLKPYSCKAFYLSFLYTLYACMVQPKFVGNLISGKIFKTVLFNLKENPSHETNNSIVSPSLYFVLYNCLFPAGKKTRRSDPPVLVCDAYSWQYRSRILSRQLRSRKVTWQISGSSLMKEN